MPWLEAAAPGTAWICGWSMVIFLRPDIPFFFYLGALVRVKQLPVTISLEAAIAVAAIFVAIVCIRALAPLAVEFCRGFILTINDGVSDAILTTCLPVFYLSLDC